ncbi:MAG: T9SS type A sorting domain-containing protein [Bacteroidota bacterium]
MPSTPLALTLAPNPLRQTATAAFDVTQGGPARLDVYDLLGWRVAAQPERLVPAGSQRVDWDLSTLPAGIYVLRVTTN